MNEPWMWDLNFTQFLKLIGAYNLQAKKQSHTPIQLWCSIIQGDCITTKSLWQVCKLDMRAKYNITYSSSGRSLKVLGSRLETRLSFNVIELWTPRRNQSLETDWWQEGQTPMHPDSHARVQDGHWPQFWELRTGEVANDTRQFVCNQTQGPGYTHKYGP